MNRYRTIMSKLSAACVALFLRGFFVTTGAVAALWMLGVFP